MPDQIAVQLFLDHLDWSSDGCIFDMPLGDIMMESYFNADSVKVNFVWTKEEWDAAEEMDQLKYDAEHVLAIEVFGTQVYLR